MSVKALEWTDILTSICSVRLHILFSFSSPNSQAKISPIHLENLPPEMFYSVVMLADHRSESSEETEALAVGGV